MNFISRKLFIYLLLPSHIDCYCLRKIKVECYDGGDDESEGDHRCLFLDIVFFFFFLRRKGN